jgi:7-cyano-7-deazaguanine synthase
VENLKSALLLSGGMDSVSLAYWLRPDYTVTIDYGQLPAKGEIQASSAVSAALGIPNIVIEVDLKRLGSGDMAGAPALDVAEKSEWWPFRNQMLITLAAMKMISLDVKKIAIGTLKTDDFHADGSLEFISIMNQSLMLQEGRMQVVAPAIKLSAAQLVRKSKIPLAILAWAHSCHVSNFACGLCRGCRKHYETQMELGVSPY